MIIIINDKLCAPRLFSLAGVLNSMENRRLVKDLRLIIPTRQTTRLLALKCKEIRDIYISERVTKHTRVSITFECAFKCCM